MRVSAWLVIEIGKGSNNWRDERQVKITKVRQTRPENEMAVKVTLQIDPAMLQPAVEAAVQAGAIVFDVVSQDDTDGGTDVPY